MGSQNDQSQRHIHTLSVTSRCLHRAPFFSGQALIPQHPDDSCHPDIVRQLVQMGIFDEGWHLYHFPHAAEKHIYIFTDIQRATSSWAPTACRAGLFPPIWPLMPHSVPLYHPDFYLQQHSKAVMLVRMRHFTVQRIHRKHSNLLRVPKAESVTLMGRQHIATWQCSALCWDTSLSFNGTENRVGTKSISTQYPCHSLQTSEGPPVNNPLFSATSAPHFFSCCLGWSPALPSLQVLRPGATTLIHPHSCRNSLGTTEWRFLTCVFQSSKSLPTVAHVPREGVGAT